jgi:hypothetical protein
MYRLLLIFLILCIFYYFSIFRKKETFNNCLCNCGCKNLGCEKCNKCPYCSFFTRSECPTRNMSYDLRGEAYFPKKINFPFNNQVIGPSNLRCYPKYMIK